MAVDTLVQPSLSFSTASFYVIDLYKTDFNSTEKHDTCLWGKATAGLLKRICLPLI